jgi:hypothetical protein
VEAAADHAHGPRVLARQLLRRHRGDSAGPKGRHGSHVHEGERLAVGRRRHADHAHHHRQPRLRIAGEGGDPLQDREAGALGGHGAEVTVGRRVEVHLRRHLPFVAGVFHEAVPDALDRIGRVDRAKDGLLGEDEEIGHPANLKGLSL